MAVDLHTHSRYSDGSDTPSELVTKAARAGLTAIALTDHDTIDGLPEAQQAATELGVEVISGTELSCEWADGTMHLVVLFLDGSSGPLQDRLSELRDGRTSRNREIVEKLNAIGVEITIDEVCEEAGEGSVGRPHFAAVLVRKGVVPDMPAAFDELLAAGRPAYAGRFRLEPGDAIALARQSGGVPVLAHPHTLSHDRAEQYAGTFRMLASAGLVGVECFYTDYELPQREDFAALATRFGLLPSGGSDYHGDYKAQIELGIGRGDLAVPDEVLGPLREASRQKMT